MNEAIMLSGMKDVDIRILNDLLILFPNYGEFDFTVFMRRIVGTLLEMYTYEEGPHVINADKVIYYFLVSQGFLKRRSAGSLDHKVVELTDKGRSLKECRTIDKYFKWEQDEKERDEKRLKLSDRLLENNLKLGTYQVAQMWFNFWIAIATIVGSFIGADSLIRNQYNTKYHAYHDYILPYGMPSTILALIIILVLNIRRKKNIQQ